MRIAPGNQDTYPELHLIGLGYASSNSEIQLSHHHSSHQILKKIWGTGGKHTKICGYMLFILQHAENNGFIHYFSSTKTCGSPLKSVDAFLATSKIYG